MSRIATNEYIGAKRRAYEASKPDKRRLILDDVCEMTGYSRKYANRLLTGSQQHKHSIYTKLTYCYFRVD